MKRNCMFGWLVALSLLSTLLGDEPWDAAPFSADSKAILDALEKQPGPAGANSEILLDEMAYDFKGDGRRHVTHRRVVHVLTNQGAQEWAVMQANWSPWMEKQPTMRARVITTDGKIHELDPKTIGEKPASQLQQNVYSDRKILVAPLPAVEAGCVIEQQFVIHEERPLFARGVSERFTLVAVDHTRLRRLKIDAPEDLPLRYKVRGIEIDPKIEKRDGRVSMVFEAGPCETFKGYEYNMPIDQPRIPVIEFSTGKSWAAVAAAYFEMVEKQIDSKMVEPLVRDVKERKLSRKETIQKLLDKVQNLVRYTGLAFGEAAIVPRGPDETLTRRYGDCKDQSLLLVAMLRAAGIDAHVALVRAGNDEGIVPELPGLNAFDHVIVHVPGDPPIWVDATNPFSPAGELPIFSQGRYALIASDKTKTLVKTPRSKSKENRTIEKTEIFLTVRGQTRVIEEVESIGSAASSTRAIYGQNNAEQIRQGWMQMMQNDYLTTNIKRLEYTGARDVTKPFRATVEVVNSPVGQINDVGASIGIRPSAILDRLPQFLTMPIQRTDVNTANFQTINLGPRKSPLYLMEPYVYDLRYRIVAPIGFKSRTLPKSSTMKFGGATLTQEYSTESDNVILARFVLDTGDEVLSAKDVDQMRTGLSNLGLGGNIHQWYPVFGFQHVAETLILEGKIREGFAEWQKLIDADPDDPKRLLQYSLSMLRNGFGDAARRFARRALELDPTSAFAEKTLAAILSHDLLGRPLQPGMDRDGALKIYEKVIAKDRTDYGPRWNQILILEHDPDGFRYGPQSQLKTSIELQRTLRQDFPNQAQLELNLMTALIHDGRFEELKAMKSAVVAIPVQNSVQVTAIAATDGTDAALKAAETLNDQFQQLKRQNALIGQTTAETDKTNLVVTAAQNLDQARRYPEAVAMYAALPARIRQGVKYKERIEILKLFKRSDEVRFADDDPRRVVQRLYELVVVGGAKIAEAAQLFANRERNDSLPFALGELNRQWRGDQLAFQQQNVSPQRRVDTISIIHFETEGDKTDGWRITARSPGKTPAVFYVVHRDGRNALWDPGETRSAMGLMALEMLAAENLKGAQQWLDWACKDEGIKSSEGLLVSDPFIVSAATRIWLPADRANNDNVRMAASALTASGSTAGKAIEFLTRIRDKATKTQKLDIDRSLARAYQTTKQGEKLNAIADRLIENHPNVVEIIEYKVRALQRLNRIDDAREFLKSRFEKRPDDALILAMLVQLEETAGNFKMADEFSKTIIDASKGVRNRIAWRALFYDASLDDALEHAKEENGVAQFRNPDYLYTLAAVCAERNELKEARTALMQSATMRGSITHDDFYVVGRMAEQAGLIDVAKNAYKKVTPPRTKNPTSAYVLAQRRLKALAE